MPRSKIPYLLDGSGNVVPVLLGRNTVPSKIQPQMPPRPSRRGVTISGVSRDSAGAALGSVRCDLLRVNEDGSYTFLETTTSDGAGSFTFYVVGPGSRYRVLFSKAGAPDLAGTTDLDLEGA